MAGAIRRLTPPPPTPGTVRWEINASWPLFLGVGLLMLGNGLHGTVVGVRAAVENFDTSTTGLVMSAYYVGFLAGSFVTPTLLSRVGHVRVFAALVSLASASVLVYLLAVHPLPWVLIRLVVGFCLAGLFVVAESWINDQATNETRGRLLSLYMVVLMGGLAGGQLLLASGDPAGFKLFIAASVIVSLAVVPMALSARPSPAPAPVERMPISQLWRRAPLGVFGALGIGFSHGSLFGLGAVYAATVGLPTAHIAVFMAVAIAGGVVLQLPLGRLSDRLERRRVIGVTSLVCAGAALVGTQVSAEAVPLTVVIGAVGATTIPLYAIVVAHTNDWLDPREMVGSSATLVFVSGVGAALGPLVTSAVMDAVGANGFFWTFAGIHATVGVYALERIFRRAAPPEEERVHFEPFSSEATAASLALSEELTGEIPVVE